MSICILILIETMDSYGPIHNVIKKRSARQERIADKIAIKGESLFYYF